MDNSDSVLWSDPIDSDNTIQQNIQQTHEQYHGRPRTEPQGQVPQQWDRDEMASGWESYTRNIDELGNLQCLIEQETTRTSKAEIDEVRRIQKLAQEPLENLRGKHLIERLMGLENSSGAARQFVMDRILLIKTKFVNLMWKFQQIAQYLLCIQNTTVRRGLNRIYREAHEFATSGYIPEEDIDSEEWLQFKVDETKPKLHRQLWIYFQLYFDLHIVTRKYKTVVEEIKLCEKNQALNAFHLSKRWKEVYKASYAVLESNFRYDNFNYAIKLKHTDEKQHIVNLESNQWVAQHKLVKFDLEDKEMRIFQLNTNYHTENRERLSVIKEAISGFLHKGENFFSFFDVICLQEHSVEIVDMARKEHQGYILRYDNEAMNVKLSEAYLPRIEKSNKTSGSLYMMINKQIQHRNLQQSLSKPIYFNQVIMIETGEGRNLVLINTYWFPDWRKQIVIQELQFVVQAVTDTYENCAICICGDFNQDIVVKIPESKGKEFIISFFPGFQFPVSVQPSHKKRLIDFCIVKNAEIKEIQIFPVREFSQLVRKDKFEHAVVLTTLKIKFKMMNRTKNVIANNSINKILKPEIELCAVQVQDWKAIRRSIQKRLLGKKKVEVVKDRNEQMRHLLYEQLEKEQYISKYQQAIRDLRGVRQPKTLHKAIKNLMKFNKVNVFAKNVQKDGVVLNENETNLAIKELFQKLYSQNQQKVVRETKPPNMFISPMQLVEARWHINKTKATSDNLIPHTVLFNDYNLSAFSKSMSEITFNQFPDQFYFQSRMVFFNKKTDGTIPTVLDIRPITITTIHQKVLEKVVHQKFKKYQRLCHFTQLGFVSGQETSMHIYRLMFKMNYYRRTQVVKKSILLFVDFEKAFDNVPHDIFLKKISILLENKKDVQFFTWYFNQLGVNIGDYRIPINKGAPQGGVLSPLIWILFMNDLLDRLDACLGRSDDISAFADDLLILLETDFEVGLVKSVLEKWTYENDFIKINYKVDKTAIVEIVHDTMEGPPRCDGDICGIPIQKQYKYLGVIVNQKLNFDSTRMINIWTKIESVRMQRLTIKKKVLVFQAYLISKFRFQLVAMQFLKFMDGKDSLTNQVLKMLMRLFRIWNKSKIEKFKENNLYFKFIAEETAESIDNRIKKKLSEWGSIKGVPYDELYNINAIAMQVPMNQIGIDWKQVWELDHVDDNFWFNLVNQGNYFFISLRCYTCKQWVVKQNHFRECLNMREIYKFFAEKYSFNQELTYDYIMHPEKLCVFTEKQQRIGIKSLIAAHLGSIAWKYQNIFKPKKKKKKTLDPRVTIGENTILDIISEADEVNEFDDLMDYALHVIQDDEET